MSIFGFPDIILFRDYPKQDKYLVIIKYRLKYFMKYATYVYIKFCTTYLPIYIFVSINEIYLYIFNLS